MNKKRSKRINPKKRTSFSQTSITIIKKRGGKSINNKFLQNIAPLLITNPYATNPTTPLSFPYNTNVHRTSLHPFPLFILISVDSGFNANQRDGETWKRQPSEVEHTA